MNLLAIDASTDCLSIALAINGEMHCAEQKATRQHAQVILPIIERLLIEADWDLKRLDGIVYGQGPGSFTGLRIACSVAKGLAYAADLPLFPVSSLAALAQTVLEKEKKLMKNCAVLAMIDARMQQIYWAYITNPLAEVVAKVSDAKDIDIPLDVPIVVTGVGYEPYLAQLPSAAQEKIVQHFPGYPGAQAMITLAASGKISSLSAAAALPAYVRNQITQGTPHG